MRHDDDATSQTPVPAQYALGVPAGSDADLRLHRRIVKVGQRQARKRRAAAEAMSAEVLARGFGDPPKR